MDTRRFLREVWSAFTHDWERQAIADTARDRIISQIVAYCPEHGTQETCRMVCHCEIAEELRRDDHSR